METYLSEVVSALNTGGEDLVSLNKPKQSSTMFEHKEVPTHSSQFEEAPDGPGNGQAAWDPRLVRIDGFLS
jgi:hypothetical protein